MMHPDNTWRRRVWRPDDIHTGRRPSIIVRPVPAATVVAMAAIVLAGIVSSAAAQDATVPGIPPGSAVADHADQLTAPRVDWSHGMKMQMLIDLWQERGTADAPAADQLDPREKPVPVTGLVGVRVTLRYGGRRLGIGDVQPRELQADDHGVVDLVETVRLATQRAMVATRETIRRQNEIGQRKAEEAGRVNPPPVFDADRILASKDHLRVDLQIGHDRKAIELSEDDPPPAIYDTFASGYHGLIMTADPPGNLPPAEGVCWPVTALESNMSQDAQLLSLLSAVNLGSGQKLTIARPGGPGLERFHCIHIVDNPRLRLIRGQVIIPRPFNVASLNAMSDRLAAHLKQRIDVDGKARGLPGLPRPGEVGPEGGVRPPQIIERKIYEVYLPSSDSVAEPASDNELALAAYALAHRAKVLALVRPGGPQFAATLTAARAAVARCEAMLILDGQAAPSPRAMGLLTLALLEAPQFANRKALRTQMTGKILRLQNEDGRFRSAPLDNARPVEPSTQAILAATLAAVYDRTRDAGIGHAAANARDAAWLAFHDHPVPHQSTFYWLLLTEKHLTAFDEPARPPRTEQDQPFNRLQRQTIADRFIKFLRERQITQAPDPDLCPEDVVGGFDLVDRLSAVAVTMPRPDWHSANVMAALSLALRTAGMVKPQERDDLLLSCSLAGRFVAQLMIDQPGAFYITVPAEALGGVRQTLDNNALHLSTTATALIAATELQQAIHEMAMEQKK